MYLDILTALGFIETNDVRIGDQDILEDFSTDEIRYLSDQIHIRQISAQMHLLFERRERISLPCEIWRFIILWSS